MSEYQLYFEQGVSTVVTVEAETMDAAKEAASELLPGSLCHHCASEWEVSGDWELNEEATRELNGLES